MRDGVWEGEEEPALVKATVRVTVKDHQIQEIQLTRHENGKGAPAEAMLPEMVRRNTSEVDTVSGATMSGKVIKAAVRSALSKGAEIVYLGCCTIPVDRARRPEAEHRPFPLHRIKRRRGAL